MSKCTVHSTATVSVSGCAAQLGILRLMSHVSSKLRPSRNRATALVPVNVRPIASGAWSTVLDAPWLDNLKAEGRSASTGIQAVMDFEFEFPRGIWDAG